MTTREKLILGTAAVLVLVLGGIAAWQNTRSNGAARDLEQVRAELGLQRQESTLALAAIEASRGSYELARQLASDFFTGVQAGIDDVPARGRETMQQILLQRDAMITALSRSDSQAAPQLIQLLIRYRIALGEPVGPGEPAAAPRADTASRADSSAAR